MADDELQQAVPAAAFRGSPRARLHGILRFGRRASRRARSRRLPSAHRDWGIRLELDGAPGRCLGSRLELGAVAPDRAADSVEARLVRPTSAKFGSKLELVDERQRRRYCNDPRDRARRSRGQGVRVEVPRCRLDPLILV